MLGCFNYKSSSATSKLGIHLIDFLISKTNLSTVATFHLEFIATFVVDIAAGYSFSCYLLIRLNLEMWTFTH